MSASEKAALATLLREEGATALETALIIDLAFNPSQPRGPDGKWIKTGMGSELKKLGSEFPGLHHASGEAHHEEIIQRAVGRAVAKSQAHTEAEIAKSRAEHHEDMAKTIRHLRLANERMKAQEKAAKTAAEAERNKKRVRALIAHAGTVIAGAILAYIEYRIGTGEVGVIASGIGPVLAHDLVDFAKRFSG